MGKGRKSLYLVNRSHLPLREECIGITWRGLQQVWQTAAQTNVQPKTSMQPQFHCGVEYYFRTAADLSLTVLSAAVVVLCCKLVKTNKNWS